MKQSSVKKVTNVRIIANALNDNNLVKGMLSEVDKLFCLYFTFPVTSLGGGRMPPDSPRLGELTPTLSSQAPPPPPPSQNIFLHHCLRGFYGGFQICIMWLLLKILCSNLVVSFSADHSGLSRSIKSSQWTKGTAMASFQRKECVQLTIASTTQLTHH